ncbi:MAG: M23 family peptidase, partial [Bacteroidales bacterium]|nr:M23 family peptidase [Bacteroidales bacterium]
MAKHTYKFNPQTLNYVKVKITHGQKVIKFLSLFVASLFLSIIYYLAFSTFVDLPKDKGLKRQITDLRSNYDILQNRLVLLDSMLSDLQKRDDNIYRTIFETEPIHTSIRDGGTGGAYKNEKLQTLENSEIIQKSADQIEKLLHKSYVQSKSYDLIIELAKDK